jgi:hypothetical protein
VVEAQHVHPCSVFNAGRAGRPGQPPRISGPRENAAELAETEDRVTAKARHAAGLALALQHDHVLDTAPTKRRGRRQVRRPAATMATRQRAGRAGSSTTQRLDRQPILVPALAGDGRDAGGAIEALAAPPLPFARSMRSIGSLWIAYLSRHFWPPSPPRVSK